MKAGKQHSIDSATEGFSVEKLIKKIIKIPKSWRISDLHAAAGNQLIGAATVVGALSRLLQRHTKQGHLFPISKGNNFPVLWLAERNKGIIPVIHC